MLLRMHSRQKEENNGELPHEIVREGGWKRQEGEELVAVFAGGGAA